MRAFVTTLGLLLLFGCAEQSGSGPARPLAAFHPSAIAYWAARDTYMVGSYSHDAVYFVSRSRGDGVAWSMPPASTRPFHVLRIAFDERRANLWLVSLEHVYVYRLTAGAPPALLGRVRVPSSRVHPRTCLPDIKIGADGAAYVTSTHAPTVAVIRPDTFDVAVHRIRLAARWEEPWGFSGLEFTSDDRFLLAIDAPTGQLWRIDTRAWEAIPVKGGGGLSGACALLWHSTEQEHRRLLVTRGFHTGVSMLSLSEDYGEARQDQTKRLANRYIFSAIARDDEIVWPERDAGAAFALVRAGSAASPFLVLRTPLPSDPPG